MRQRQAEASIGMSSAPPPSPRNDGDTDSIKLYDDSYTTNCLNDSADTDALVTDRSIDRNSSVAAFFLLFPVVLGMIVLVL